MRLITSDLALRIALALAAVSDLSLTEIARAVAAAPSAAQRALSLLLSDEVVVRVAGTRPRYRLRSTERASLVTDLALNEVPFARAVVTAARANPSIEFAARAGETFIVVFAPFTALTQASATRFLDRLAAREGLRASYLDHDDLRRELLGDPGLRRRMARAKILHGSLDRTFPDRSGHARRRGVPLHRANRALRRPTRSFLARLARTHHLEKLALFGSSVRSDFRPDSDVDVLVRYRRSARPSLRSLIDVERALEGAFGRDVDLVREETLSPDAHDRITAEAVPLL